MLITLQNLINKIAKANKKGLPFVVYNKPNSKQVMAFFQKDDQLNYQTNFEESGFVFAPFDSTQPSIFLSSDKCEIHQVSVDNKDIKDVLSKSNTKNSLNLINFDKESRDNHIALVIKGINLIKEGEVSKVVLSRKEEVSFKDIDLIKTFLNLLDNYPLAFAYIWFHPKVGLWMGASPETLISVKNKRFKTMALAGTQSYVDSLEVQWRAKEKEEQGIVTDFIVSELKDFELKISKPFTKKAGSLLHICTEIRGEFNSKNQLAEIIKKLHPTPAICGLPKTIAKEFILNNENYNREFYTGFLGELNIDKSTNLFVNLRCMQIKNNNAIVYIGGGITLDSNPENEWEETVAKSNVMKSVIVKF